MTFAVLKCTKLVGGCEDLIKYTAQGFGFLKYNILTITPPNKAVAILCL